LSEVLDVAAVQGQILQQTNPVFSKLFPSLFRETCGVATFC